MYSTAEDNLGSPEETITAWKQVFREVYSFVGDRSEAEDITQEAFVILFREAESGRKVEHFGAWMKTVTRRLAHRRFHKVRPDLHVSLAADYAPGAVDAPDPSPSIEQRVIDEDLLRLGAKILSQFSVKDRKCIMMYFRGYDYHQIARAHGVSRWTARRATLKAIHKLQVRIGQPQK